MKIIFLPPVWAACASFALALMSLATSSAFAQGALTPPPGAPAPTMKSLDQIEARSIVNAANTPGDATNTFIIRTSGSYYLTGNLAGTSGKHGISIQASDVTLDLNGFVLTGTGGLVDKGVVFLTTATNSCVRNGSVRNWAVGVQAGAAGMLVEKLRLSGNGAGLSTSNGSIVRDCVATANAIGFSCNDRTQLDNCIATENTGAGFACTNFVSLLDCTASRNGADGIDVGGGSSVSRCTSTRNGFHGIDAFSGCTISDCTLSSNASNGIRVALGSTVRNCTVNSNGNAGISVGGSSPGDDCTVTGNNCTQNGFFGIVVYGDRNRVDGNACTSNPKDGFYFVGTRNLVVRNNASGNNPDYRFQTANPARIVDLRSGVFDATASPWANFQH